MIGRHLLKAKARAGLVHLGLSAVLVGALSYLTLTVWYPQALASIQGVWKILGLVVLVDVILGPALTFIVYAPRKRTLVFDLGVIAAVQLAALVYGAWTIEAQRPAYLAYLHDRFFVVTERDILDEVPSEVIALPQWHGGPRPVFVKLSFAAQQEAAAAAETTFDTPAMALLAGAYAPLAEYAGQLISNTASGFVAAPVVTAKVIGRARQGVARIDASTGELLDISAD